MFKKIGVENWDGTTQQLETIRKRHQKELIRVGGTGVNVTTAKMRRKAVDTGELPWRAADQLDTGGTSKSRSGVQGYWMVL